VFFVLFLFFVFFADFNTHLSGFSKSLVHPRRHRPELRVHLAGRASHDQADQRVFGHFDVLESPQNVDVAANRKKCSAQCVQDEVQGREEGIWRGGEGGEGRGMGSYVSAKTILVRETFSIVNLVFPSFPARRPTALDK